MLLMPPCPTRIGSSERVTRPTTTLATRLPSPGFQVNPPSCLVTANSKQRNNVPSAPLTSPRVDSRLQVKNISYPQGNEQRRKRKLGSLLSAFFLLVLHLPNCLLPSVFYLLYVVGYCTRSSGLTNRWGELKEELTAHLAESDMSLDLVCMHGMYELGGLKGSHNKSFVLEICIA
jgi:hypothetical protein